MRHLYTLSSIPQPQKEALIAVAKGMERRRCNHHELENPLSTLECFSNVIDPKNSRTNKNRYVVASQDEEVRKYCRAVKGVPLVYVKRSVMVMEPMAVSSVGVREGLERGKFRMGLRGKGQAVSLKRKREDSSEEGDAENSKILNGDNGAAEEKAPKKKKIRGPKGPNPLSVKKPRKAKDNKDERAKVEKNLEKAQEASPSTTKQSETDQHDITTIDVIEGAPNKSQKPPAKRKRKRKHKTSLLAALGDKINDDDLQTE